MLNLPAYSPDSSENSSTNPLSPADSAIMWLKSVPWTNKGSTDPWLVDRRRSVRHRLTSPATLIDESTGRQALGIVSDLSLFGIGIRVSSPVDIRSTFKIEVESKTMYLPSRRAQVRSCRKTSDGRFELGMEFVGIQMM